MGRSGDQRSQDMRSTKTVFQNTEGNFFHSFTNTCRKPERTPAYINFTKETEHNRRHTLKDNCDEKNTVS